VLSLSTENRKRLRRPSVFHRIDFHYFYHNMLSTISSALSGASDQSVTNRGVTPALIREIINEVASTRNSNLAFRQSVQDHEQNAIAQMSPSALSGPSVSASRSSSSSSRSGGSKMQPVNRTDLKLKPPSPSIPQGIPKNVSSQIFWDVVKIRTKYDTSLTGDYNYAFAPSLQSHPQFSQLIPLFDQWCIPQFSVTWMALTPPGSTGTVIELHTAIDFDNVANLTLQQIDQFDCARVDTLVDNKKVTRTCRPRNKTTVGGTANAGVTATWVDSAVSATPWFGIRSIIAMSYGLSQSVVAEQTIWFAFRGRI